MSQPVATTATPASTATPKPRRSHSPAPRDRLRTVNTRPPARRARPRDVAAPRAYATSTSEVLTLAPLSAAPAVRTRPRIGPAQGAHSNPVATPRTTEGNSPGRAMVTVLCSDRRWPSATNGRARCWASLSERSVAAKRVRHTPTQRYVRIGWSPPPSCRRRRRASRRPRRRRPC